MLNYKEHINLLENNSCNDCIFMNYKYNPVYARYFDKGFSTCLASVACFCEEELKMKEEQIIKHINKYGIYCYLSSLW